MANVDKIWKAYQRILVLKSFLHDGPLELELLSIVCFKCGFGEWEEGGVGLAGSEQHKV